MIAALFVDPRGIYSTFEGVECWGEERDARTYAGPWPVVAHPPCSRWCQLASVNEARYGHRIGDDGGAFASALENVRRVGGVLEHPAFTIAWATFGLNNPPRSGWARAGIGDAGWVCHVEQGLYGHRARKATWLYAIGVELPAMRWGRAEPKATVSFCRNHGGGDLPRLSKREASATPRAFAEVLISTARTARKAA
jgi:hypothetical protein